ncbi:MAG: hypothetical protein ACLFWM_05680 [Actinomycetota bacterium]
MRNLIRMVALLAALALVAAACGGDTTSDTTEAAPDTTAAGPDTTAESADTTSAAPDTTAGADTTMGEGGLAGVCPDPIVIQNDWEPEAEHGGLYELVGEPYEIDTEFKRVRGPLVSQGEETGVDVEIRIGGSAVGFQQTGALMYQDTDIFLGMLRLVEGMEYHEELPVVGVMGMFEKSPFSVYWDPETYPEAETIADLKEHDTVIMFGRPDSFIDYLVAEGIVNESQVDTSDMGKPAAFIGRDGEWAEAGFATAEPYLYEFEVPEWGKPVELQLIHDTGWEEYFQTLGVRAEDVTAEADCLERLVPILQQGLVDYYADPDPTNELILELVDAYDTGWVYSEGAAEFSVQQQLELGIVSNGANDYIGEFDMDRVAGLMELVDEVTEIDVSGLAPEDVATNEFIDSSIGLEG